MESWDTYDLHERMKLDKIWEPIVVTPRTSIELYQVHTFNMGIGKPSNLGTVLLDGITHRSRGDVNGTVDARVEDRWRVHGLSPGYEVLYRGEDVYSGSMAPDRLYSKLVNGGHTCS